jgi:hypothetical protein
MSFYIANTLLSLLYLALFEHGTAAAAAATE